MSIDINEKYFIIIGMRENSEKRLKKEKISCIGNNKYMRESDNSIWIERFSQYNSKFELSGFMKQPEPDFSELWRLCVFSNIEDNKIGSLLIIEELYGEELLEELMKIRSNENTPQKQKQALKLIKCYSLPFGAFHWKRNIDLNQNQKAKITDTWTQISQVIDKTI